MAKKKKTVKKAKKKVKEIPEEITNKIEATFMKERVVAEFEDLAKQIYDQSRFGEPKEGKMQYSLVEALFLLENGKMLVRDSKGKEIKFDKFVKTIVKTEPKFWVRYCVYRDMRKRGYIVKTALKFGADFRVYDRGIKPGEDHARWIVFPVHESSDFTWYEFAAKNRVAHSTRKRLLLAIVDDENDVTYYECAWKRP